LRVSLPSWHLSQIVSASGLLALGAGTRILGPVNPSVELLELLERLSVVRVWVWPWLLISRWLAGRHSGVECPSFCSFSM